MTGHTLLTLATQPIPQAELELPPSQFYEVGRGWMLDRFSHLLPSSTVQDFVSFHSIQQNGGRDEIVWSGTPSGAFTTKSAFELIAGCRSHRHEEVLWKEIWRITGPQRVRVFLWKLCNQGILMNAIRV